MIEEGIVPEFVGKKQNHLLIVEKDPLQAYLLKISFQEAGWVVRLAGGPEEALVSCEYGLFDAAIINYYYPGNINGCVLSDLLQKRFYLSSLMITASRYVELKRDAAFNPNQDLLFKPYRLSECGPRLQRLMTGVPVLREHRLGVSV